MSLLKKAITIDDVSKHNLESLYWFFSHQARRVEWQEEDILKRWKNRINDQYKKMTFGDRCTIVFKGNHYDFIVKCAELATSSRDDAKISGLILKCVENGGKVYGCDNT